MHVSRSDDRSVASRIPCGTWEGGGFASARTRLPRAEDYPRLVIAAASIPVRPKTCSAQALINRGD